MTNGISISPGTRDICALHHVHQGAIGYCAKPIPEETCIIGSWVLRIVFKYSKFGGRGPYTRPLSVSSLIRTSASHTITARWPPSWSSNRKGSIWESYTALGIEPRTFSYPGRFIYHSIVEFVGLKKTYSNRGYIYSNTNFCAWLAPVHWVVWGAATNQIAVSLLWDQPRPCPHQHHAKSSLLTISSGRRFKNKYLHLLNLIPCLLLFSCVKAHFKITRPSVLESGPFGDGILCNIE